MKQGTSNNRLREIIDYRTYDLTRNAMIYMNTAHELVNVVGRREDSGRRDSQHGMRQHLRPVPH